MMRRPWGARTRIVLVSVAVVSGLLLVWGLVFLYVLDQALASTARQSARSTATSVVDGLKVRKPRDLVPAHSPQVGERTIQVVDASGAVVAWSRSDGRARPLASARPAVGTMVLRSESRLPGIDADPFVIAVTGARGMEGERYTVIVAEPIHVEESEVARLAAVVLVSSLVLFGILAVVVGRAVGAALAPVERMRGQVKGITAEGLDTTVDVPPGGDELSRLGQTLNDMLARLESSDRARRAFVADAGHELRGPLATIRVSLDRLRTGLPDPEHRDIADRAERETERLGDLVGDLLLLATADEHGIRLDRQTLDLDDLVLLETRGARRRVPVDLRLEPTQITGDPRRLGQVVRNLLDNAERHARSGMRVTVSPSGAGAVLAVDNDGPVVPRDEREHIFDRFVRLDESRGRESGGTGLGLAIVAEIVRSHAGTVTAGEADDGWCRFEVRLPGTAEAPAAQSPMVTAARR